MAFGNYRQEQCRHFTFFNCIQIILKNKQKMAYSHVYFIALLSVVLVLSEHDHNKHVNIAFINGESRRIAWYTLTDMIDSLKDYSDSIRFVEQKYEDLFLNPREGNEDRIKEIWRTHFEPSYRETYDRALILSHVCHDIYEDS
jgi:hypothetical protein